MKRIAFITSGGDAPGMNACVRAIVKTCLNNSITPVAYFDGYQGMIENRYKEMQFKDVDNVIQQGGTIIGTARSEEFRTPEGRLKAKENLIANKIDGFICIGGDGSFKGAQLLASEMDIPVIGIPGTIDNDIYGTDHTIGFDTALNTVIEAVDRIRDTASSHKRLFFIEVMGRDAGFIALSSAIASGADSVLIPEELTDFNVLIKDIKNQNKGRRGSIIIVAEGDDGGGAKEVCVRVQSVLNDYSCRYSVLGHIQRGGRPSALDRKLASILGVNAVLGLMNGEADIMLGVFGDKIEKTSLTDAISKKSHPKLDGLSVLNNLITSH